MSEASKKRNALCDCGSGKKNKFCCGQKSLWIMDHPAWPDEKTCQAVDEADATVQFESFFNAELEAGNVKPGPDGPYTFLDATVYKDGSKVEWIYDHPGLKALKTCEAVTQVEAWEKFDVWFKKEVAAGRMSGKLSDGRIYKKTEPPPQARATCNSLPRHKDSKGQLYCEEHAGTADGILVDVVLTDGQNPQGFRCCRPARLA